MFADVVLSWGTARFVAAYVFNELQTCLEDPRGTIPISGGGGTSTQRLPKMMAITSATWALGHPKAQ